VGQIYCTVTRYAMLSRLSFVVFCIFNIKTGVFGMWFENIYVCMCVKYCMNSDPDIDRVARRSIPSPVQTCVTQRCGVRVSDDNDKD
jgi:hypothetical protein